MGPPPILLSEGGRSSLSLSPLLTWISFLDVSVFSRHGMMNAAVFPVPFLARARTFLFCRMMGMASSWMGEGRSKPFSKMPIRRGRLRKKSSHCGLVCRKDEVWLVS